MTETKSTLSQIRKIDNIKRSLSWVTSLLLIFLIALFVWFFRGGSFRLYASIFFSLYYLTHQIWLSVLLIGIIQNIMFIPFRIIGSITDQPLKDFEEELDKQDTSQQLVIFTKKVEHGSFSIIFYIFNFFVNAIAFFSAGRIFLIDFYNKPLDPKLLYKWVPYPNYPLNGTDFKLPFLKITQTYAVPWQNIFTVIGSVVLFLVASRLVWRLFRFLFKKNQKILYARIRYNRLLSIIGGSSVFLLLIITFILRHIPTAFEGILLVVDLTRQNTPMNFVTAVGTFITTIHAGYKNNSLAANQAKLSGIDPKVIKKVFSDQMKNSIKNAFILGLGAFFITNQIPSAFELSVATFEAIYMVYPYTFGRFVHLGTKNLKPKQNVTS